VVDPKGEPMAGVPVDVMGRPRIPRLHTRDAVEGRVVLGHGATDANGHYRIDATRSSFAGFFEVFAIAAAPGFGLASIPINADAPEPAADLRLLPERVLRGKLVDVNGQPAAGVELRVGSVGRPTRIGTFDGVNLGLDPPPEGLRVWPRPVTTDNAGRFTLSGIGPDFTVALRVHDPRFAQQSFRVQTEDRPDAREITLALLPPSILTGRVLAADTGLPVAGTVVARARADGQGRFTANLAPNPHHRIEAYPPEGLPYLASRRKFDWTKGAVKKELDITLPRGVLIRGKVAEAGTGRPLGGASVQYLAARSRDDVLDGWQAVVASQNDGSYQIVVPPGKGHLFIYGPTPDYVLDSIGGRTLYEGRTGGERYYAHAIMAYDVKAGDSPRAVAAALRPGQTVRGHIVGPDGQTVDKAEIVAVLHFNYFHLNWRGDLTIHARDGSFALHGLDPNRPTRVSFLDADHQWGATVELSGKPSGEDVTVRLQPCGTARARFVGPSGKPVAKIASHLEIVGTPGPHQWDQRPESKFQLSADAAAVINLDRKHYWNGPLTDADGRITLPDLIPGALYRLSDHSTMNVEDKGVQARRDFSVKSGETLDLGDIRIEKPPE
jgi:hypothetical protein